MINGCTSPCRARRWRTPHRHHCSVDRDHRSRRLFHPDEHGFAADVARRHPEPQVSRLAQCRVQRRRHGTVHAGGRARARGVAIAPIPGEGIGLLLPGRPSRFIGPDTRVVAVSTHNPLGVTFAAGVYTSIFGSARQPINSHYAREMFRTIKVEPLPTEFQSDRRRVRRLAGHPDQFLGRPGRRLRSRRA